MAQPRGIDPARTAIVRGFVVAGGRSSRMGRDKALLRYADSTLLEHAIAKVRALTDDLRILCGPSRRYEEFGVPVVEDAVCGIGPLGGLYSALVSAAIDGRDQVLWLGVDLPRVPVSLLTDLVLQLGPVDVAMARTDHGLEPLCAAFRTQPTLACVRKSLLAGQLKITAALEGLQLRNVNADVASFVNVNSPAEYESLA